MQLEIQEDKLDMITLINPPNPPNRVSNKDMMGGFGQCYPPECEVKVPPIDLPYISAVLRESGIDVRVIECLGSSISTEKLLQELENSQKDLICIRTSTPTFLWDIEVAKKIKGKIGSHIVFFGPHVGVAPDDIIKSPYVDALVIGEPEYIIRNIAVNGFKKVLGVWYKEDEKIIKNKPEAFIENLDELPFPAWDLLPSAEYTIGDLMPEGKPTLFLQTSRGCPFGCSYCPYPLAQGKKYRKRSPQNVLEEVAYLVKNFDVKNILIRDPEFTLDRDRVVEICEGLISVNYGFAWRCETRVDSLDESLIDLMKRAGCVGINLGIESKSEEVCKNVGRLPLKEEHTKNIIKKCRELGIHTFCFFIIGLPGDNIKTALDTIMYALDLKPDISQFTVATPYMKTKLHKWALDNNFIETFSLDGTTGYESLMRNENLSSREIQLLREGAQSMLDKIQQTRIKRGKENLRDNKTIVSRLMDLYFSKHYSKDRRRVVVYGISGISVSRLKKNGFDVLAIIDEKHEGKMLCGYRILSPPFATLFKPEAIIVSPFKNTSNLREQLKDDSLFIECFVGLKRQLVFIKRLFQRKRYN